MIPANQKQRRSLIVFLICAILSTFSGCGSRVEEPVFLDDRAALLSRSESDRIREFSEILLKDLDIQISLVILKNSPANLNQKASELFEALKIGASTSDARGLLFLLDPEGRQLRVEVSYELEELYPDAFVSYLTQRQMRPFFENDRVGAGVEAAMELFVEQGLGKFEIPAPDNQTGAAANSPQELSGGAGVRADVEIGSGSSGKVSSPQADHFGPQSTPLKALEVYQTVLESRIKDPELGVYTAATREFFRDWLVTDAQQDNGFKHLTRVVVQTEILQQGILAVARYPLNDRQAHPFFFERGSDGWMLDFATMNKIVGFNHRNQWFFRDVGHRYMFAFEDLHFDNNGFPHKKP